MLGVWNIRTTQSHTLKIFALRLLNFDGAEQPHHIAAASRRVHQPDREKHACYVMLLPQINNVSARPMLLLRAALCAFRIV